MSPRKQLALAAISMALAVGLGAFGAHGLKSILTVSALQTWHTANLYHFIHSLGLLAIGLSGLCGLQHKLIRLSYPTMLAGILIFSGSLYVLALSGIGILGAITPIGGVLFITSWVIYALGLLRSE